MTLLFYLVPPSDIEAADRQRYWEPYLPEPKRKKKVYKIIMRDRQAEAEPLSLREFVTELEAGRNLFLKRRLEEQTILHLLLNGEL